MSGGSGGASILPERQAAGRGAGCLCGIAMTSASSSSEVKEIEAGFQVRRLLDLREKIERHVATPT